MPEESRTGEAPTEPRRAKFPRTLRLRRSADFSRVQRGGRRVSRRDLLVLWSGNDQPGPRIGLAVSRKVGTAVVRNRVKRWLREAVRHERHGLPAVDVVLIARPSAAGSGAAALRQQVAEAFDRIRSAP